MNSVANIMKHIGFGYQTVVLRDTLVYHFQNCLKITLRKLNFLSTNKGVLTMTRLFDKPTVETLLNQCEKLTNPDLSVDDLYVNLKYLRETVEAIRDDEKDKITVAVSGDVGVGKTAVSLIIRDALLSHGVECTAEELEQDLRMIGGKPLLDNPDKVFVEIKEECLRVDNSRDEDF